MTAVTIAGGTTPAFATSVRVNCAASQTICVDSVYHSTYGTVKISADVAGPGSTALRWILQRPDGTTQCYGDFKRSDGPRGWYCYGVGVGQYKVRLYDPYDKGWLQWDS